MYSQHLW